MIWTRPVLLSALAGILAMGACTGGDPVAQPTSATSPSPTSASPTTPAQPTVGSFRACHKRHDTSIVLIFLFENRDRELLGGFQGPVDFRVSPVDPTRWTTMDREVTVEPGRNANVRQITVPPGQVVPATVTLSVAATDADDPSNVLATNEVSIAVPSTSCAAA
ncbi:MAG: hypothetical protein ABJC60_01055 [Actinomycetota bacterium]